MTPAPTLVFVLAAVALAYGPVIRDLARTWVSVPYYSYGALVPAFSAFLLWDARRELAGTMRERVRPHLSAISLGLVLGGAAALAVGTRTGSLCLAALSLPCVLAGAALTTLGPARFRPVAFPIAFLALMAPMPEAAIDALSLPMQYGAAAFTEIALRVIGIPVTRDGLFLYLQPVTVHVTEACNGLRFLLAMAVIGVALAWATQRSWRGRLAVVALALATAVVANMIRVLVTAVLAEVFGAYTATGAIHVASGKLVYLASLGPFALGVLVIRRTFQHATSGGSA